MVVSFKFDDYRLFIDEGVFKRLLRKILVEFFQKVLFLFRKQGFDLEVFQQSRRGTDDLFLFSFSFFDLELDEEGDSLGVDFQVTSKGKGRFLKLEGFYFFDSRVFKIVMLIKEKVRLQQLFFDFIFLERFYQVKKKGIIVKLLEDRNGVGLKLVVFKL